MYIFFFFFSSRRRHTRLQGDWSSDVCSSDLDGADGCECQQAAVVTSATLQCNGAAVAGDRKSTRLNSSHLVISYAVFCLKKKKKKYHLIFITKRYTKNNRL